jgi:YHS domain-containing protein
MVRNLGRAGSSVRAMAVVTSATLALALGAVSVLSPTPAAADHCCGDGGSAGGAEEGGHEGGHDGGGARAADDAAPSHDHGTAPGAADPAGPGLLVDLANAKCPVMGGKPDGRTWSEWKGLRVGHCCAMCVPKFAANPERYVKQTGADWKAALAAVEKVNAAKGADRERALAALKKKWTVVREGAAPAPGLLVDLGNETCPVMGGKPDGTTWSEWNGLRVGHCCPGCTAKFQADPEQALNAKRIDWKSAAQAVAKVEEATGAARVKALEALRKKWKVLREPAPEPEPAK